MRMRNWSYLPCLAAVLALLLSACGGGKKETYVDTPVDTLYNRAMNSVIAEDWSKAAGQFEEVDRQHPYSVWATKAQLMAAYALYEGSKYDQSIVAADRFIQLHPGHRDVAYAYYLKALDYYVQIADVGRDQQQTQRALAALGEVVRRFPDSRYGRDAQLKMQLATDHLAGKEMEIGRFYEQQRYYLAAINRFRRVVDQYQSTTHVPEALERLTECYLALGLKNEAEKTAAVLGYNYPGSKWYGSAYSLMTGHPNATADNDKGWFGSVVGAIF
ncbi:MAG TPA: outer membrane protein assembly factor BamD [Stellaceae bacterium]